MSRRRWRFALRLLVSAGVLTLLLVLLPWDEVRGGASRVSLPLWTALLAGFLVGHGLGIAKWRMILNAVNRGKPLGPVDAARCHAAGLFANLYLPTIVGGDVLRGILAGRETGRAEAAVLGGLADRLIDVVALGCLIAVGSAVAWDLLAARGVAPGVLPGLLIGALGMAAGLLTVTALLRRPPRRWVRPTARVRRALRGLRRRPSVAVGALALSLTMQASFVVLTAILGAAVGADVPLGGWFLAWPLAKVVGMMPVSLGGLGVRDAALAGLLVPFGVPASVGVVTGLAWQSVVLAGGLLGGGLWWWLERARARRHAESRYNASGRWPRDPRRGSGRWPGRPGCGLPPPTGRPSLGHGPRTRTAGGRQRRKLRGVRAARGLRESSTPPRL